MLSPLPVCFCNNILTTHLKNISKLRIKELEELQSNFCFLCICRMSFCPVPVLATLRCRCRCHRQCYFCCFLLIVFLLSSFAFVGVGVRVVRVVVVYVCQSVSARAFVCVCACVYVCAHVLHACVCVRAFVCVALSGSRYLQRNKAQFQTSSMRAWQVSRSVYISVRNGNTGNPYTKIYKRTH